MNYALIADSSKGGKIPTLILKKFKTETIFEEYFDLLKRFSLYQKVVFVHSNKWLVEAKWKSFKWPKEKREKVYSHLKNFKVY